MSENKTEQPRKSLWGYGIAAVYTAFALGTLGVVALTMTQKVELVSNDYYQQEVAYEQQIERQRQTNKLVHDATCKLTADGKFIEIKFPSAMATAKGHLKLYRPSDSSLDREFEVTPDAGGTQLIAADKLTSGYWRVKLQWKWGGQSYYSEYLLMVK